MKTNFKTKKEVRDRYIEILRNRAQTVPEILEAEEKIRTIQEEIESIQGRLKYLKNRSRMSQVHLDLYQKIPMVELPKTNKKSFLNKVKSSFSTGWNLIQNLIIGLITIWPLLLILGFVLSVKRNLIRNFRK